MLIDLLACSCILDCVHGSAVVVVPWGKTGLKIACHHDDNAQSVVFC